MALNVCPCLVAMVLKSTITRTYVVYEDIIASEFKKSVWFTLLAVRTRVLVRDERFRCRASARTSSTIYTIYKNGFKLFPFGLIICTKSFPYF